MCSQDECNFYSQQKILLDDGTKRKNVLFEKPRVEQLENGTTTLKVMKKNLEGLKCLIRMKIKNHYE